MNKLTQPHKCSKCGKTIDVPNIWGKDLKSFKPYCATGVLFTCAWLICHGWHILDDGIGGRRPFFCPDCWDGKSPELEKLSPYEDWVKQGEEWLRNRQEESK